MPIKPHEPTEGKSWRYEENERDIADIPKRGVPCDYTGDPYGRGNAHQREANRNIVKPEVEEDEDPGAQRILVDPLPPPHFEHPLDVFTS